MAFKQVDYILYALTGWIVDSSYGDHNRPNVDFFSILGGSHYLDTRLPLGLLPR